MKNPTLRNNLRDLQNERRARPKTHEKYKKSAPKSHRLKPSAPDLTNRKSALRKKRHPKLRRRTSQHSGHTYDGRPPMSQPEHWKKCPPTKTTNRKRPRKTTSPPGKVNPQLKPGPEPKMPSTNTSHWQEDPPPTYPKPDSDHPYADAWRARNHAGQNRPNCFHFLKRARINDVSLDGPATIFSPPCHQLRHHYLVKACTDRTWSRPFMTALLYN